jgi:hypothetical protein
VNFTIQRIARPFTDHEGDAFVDFANQVGRESGFRCSRCALVD